MLTIVQVIPVSSEMLAHLLPTAVLGRRFRLSLSLTAVPGRHSRQLSLLTAARDHHSRQVYLPHWHKGRIAGVIRA
jgi:hypothetical protein